MSRVEAFATRIKIESSDQSPFLRADQRIKITFWTAKIKESKMCTCNLAFDPQKIKQSKVLERTIQWSSTFYFQSNKSRSWSQNISDYSLDDIHRWFYLSDCIKINPRGPKLPNFLVGGMLPTPPLDSTLYTIFSNSQLYMEPCMSITTAIAQWRSQNRVCSYLGTGT